MAMACKVEENVRLADPTLLDKIDKLRELNVSEYIPLPQLVVVGDQSSGKSSVLEGLTELPFPRDSGLCTRFATQITFRRTPFPSISVSIIPSPDSTSERTEKLRAFRKDNLESLGGQIFVHILMEVYDVLGIPKSGEALSSGQSTFTDDVLKIELCGPDKQHLSVIDIPGIFRTPTPGVTTKTDMALVRRIVHHYIENKRTIILAVIPAPTDIATQEILTMAEEVDPNGERTLGVLTKPDLVDKGGEHNVIDLVQGEKKPLRLGYCIVRNRGQNELSASSSDRHDRENEFFRTQPWASLNKERVGLVALQNRLRELLVDITRREFPRVKIEIEKALAESQKRLAGLGPSRESKEQQQQYLIKLATEFQKLTDDALDARYGRHDLLGDPDLRLPTLVVRLSDKFSKDLHACGHTVCLEAAKSKAAETKPTATLPSTPGESSGQADTEKGYPERSFGEVWSDEYPELSELLGEAYNCPLPLEDDPMVWIAAEFHASRGFEIGTFNPAILSTLWKEQSAKWEGLALNYIKRVIFVVHSFMQGVLWELCPDDHVIRHNLLSLLMEEVMHRYQQAVEHVKFILRVERSGSLLTMNHYFAENLEKAREERRRVALNEQSFSIAEGGGPVVLLDQAVRSAPVGNAEHSVQEIHDILKSYYKVVRKRFVDAVCTQGADYHLITGTNGPLRVFSPALIASLSAEQLNFIAGEELVSRRERRTLMQQIEALKQGKKLLAI